MIGQLVLLGIVLLLVVEYLKPSRPPGPPRLPLVGSIPWTNTRRGMLDFFLLPSVVQNKVSTVTMGLFHLFVINDFNLAKELFSKDEFSGRPTTKFALAHRFFNNKRQGIVATEGDQWKSQRRFSLRVLKDFGFGKRSLESLMYIEVEELRDTFLANSGDILIANDFNIPIINVLWQLVAGQRLSPEDPKSQRLVDMVTEMFQGNVAIINILPLWILRMFPSLTGFQKRVNVFSSHKKFLIDIVEQHKRSLVHDDPQDFIDVYLLEMEKDPDLTKEDLVITLQDLFFAGTETSSTTLKWAVLFLSLHQEVQTKCRDELNAALSGVRPSLSDLPRLPYLQAAITEIQRVSRVAPCSLPHRTTKTTSANGYTFPENSIFVANLSYFMHDPEHFKDPQLFRPERFLSQGGTFCKEERVVPFGVGKRYCMGEILARNEIFLFLSTLLQDVIFLPPTSHPLPDPSHYHASFTSIPHDFYVIVKSL